MNLGEKIRQSEPEIEDLNKKSLFLLAPRVKSLETLLIFDPNFPYPIVWEQDIRLF